MYDFRASKRSGRIIITLRKPFNIDLKKGRKSFLQSHDVSISLRSRTSHRKYVFLHRFGCIWKVHETEGL